MAPEGDALGPHVAEAEGAGYVVRAAVEQTVAPEQPRETENRTLDDAEFHDGLVEIFGAGGAVYAVRSQERGDELLVALDGEKEDFSCDVPAHVLKITPAWHLFNPDAVRGFD